MCNIKFNVPVHRCGLVALCMAAHLQHKEIENSAETIGAIFLEAKHKLYSAHGVKCFQVRYIQSKENKSNYKGVLSARQKNLVVLPTVKDV